MLYNSHKTRTLDTGTSLKKDFNVIESNFLVEIVLRIRIDSGFLDPDPYLDTDPRIRVTKIL